MELHIRGVTLDARPEVKKQLSMSEYKSPQPKPQQKDSIIMEIITWSKRYFPHEIHPLGVLCEKLHITHKLLHPRTPWYNGKVEHSHRNDQELFYNYLQFYSYEDLQIQMKRYRRRKRYDGEIRSLVECSHRPYHYPEQHRKRKAKLLWRSNHMRISVVKLLISKVKRSIMNTKNPTLLAKFFPISLCQN